MYVGAAVSILGRIYVTTPIDLQDQDSPIGFELRARRGAMGLSVDDVAAKLCISKDYVLAIETCDTDALPGAGYVTGFVRSYANLLGMNAKDAVQRYKAETEVATDTRRFKAPHFVARREIRLPRGSAAALLIAVTFTTLAMWYGTSTTAQSPQLISEASESTAIVDALPTISLDPAVITIEAVSTSWIEIRGADNTVVASRILTAGENFELPRQDNMVLAARDGGAIKIHRAGNISGPLGPKGAPLRAYPLP